MNMLDANNIMVKSFRVACDKIQNFEYTDANYNLPSMSEVDALIVGDLYECLGQRDILV